MKTSAQLIDRTSIILQDTGNTWFSDVDIASQMQDCLPEISAYLPFKWRHIKMLCDSATLGKQQMDRKGHQGRELDVSDIDDLISINKIENPVGRYPPVYRKFSLFGNTVFLEKSFRDMAGPQTDSSGNTQYLTGTVTFTSGSTAITGSGTAFTTELEPGYYISKSGTNNWYRVASITNDTALVLAGVSDDNGADTAGDTRYWFEYVYLFCEKNHYLEATQTDLSGTIDSGVAGGYAEGCWKINVDALGTGTMAKGVLFTIAGVDGIYRITEDATIGTNEATLKIEPRLMGVAPENAVVTFYPSSLTPALEDALCELTAGKVALNFICDSRTALDNAVTAYGLANTQVDLITARVAQIVTDAGTARTAASANFTLATGAITTGVGTALTNACTAVLALHDLINDYVATAVTNVNTDAEAAADALQGLIGDYTTAASQALTAIGLANDEIDQAVSDVDAHRTDLTNNDTALNAALTSLTDEATQAIDDLDDGRTYIDTIPIGIPGEQSYATMASGQLGIISAKVKEIQALIAEGGAYSPVVSGVLQTARGFLNEASARIQLERSLISEQSEEITKRLQIGNANLNIEKTLTNENSLEAGRYLQQANEYKNQALAYLNADAQKVNNLYKTIIAEARAIQSYVTQANGYINESSMSLKTASAVTNMTKWAEVKINYAISLLKQLRPSVRIRRSG